MNDSNLVCRKDAFQKDAYRPLVNRIREGGLSSEGVCLPSEGKRDLPSEGGGGYSLLEGLLSGRQGVACPLVLWEGRPPCEQTTSFVGCKYSRCN